MNFIEQVRAINNISQCRQAETKKHPKKIVLGTTDGMATEILQHMGIIRPWDSLCTKYYQALQHLRPEFPKAYTELPENVRKIIANSRRISSRKNN